jgi:hypothetical protein
MQEKKETLGGTDGAGTANTNSKIP